MITTCNLDGVYSTTRLVTHDPPILEKHPDDTFQTLLLLPIGEGRQGEGGLRTQGYFKHSLPNKPLITVITVVFNGEKYLEETILSVINQTYDNVEYIIIDGGSTDGTLNIILKYEYALDYWVSEKDKGIYDAMNKGIDLTTGDWINFMNGGDSFYRSNILEKIHLNKIQADVVYGDCEVTYESSHLHFPNKKTTRYAKNHKALIRGMPFSHQSTFTKSILLKRNKFTTALLTSDFEFFLLLLKKNKTFFQINKIIASVSADGVSDKNRIIILLSYWITIKTNTLENPDTYFILHIIKEILKESIKKILIRK